MMKKFLAPNDPLLVQKAQEISIEQINSLDIKQNIEKMLKVAFGEQTDRTKPVLVGLAAPQIGISKRIILVDVKANGKGDVGDLRIYINPKIIWKSSDQNEWYEGCYSTDRVCGIVSRPTKIKIRAFYVNNSFPHFKWELKNIVEAEEEYEGYTARIFQHEIDHLDGKEFVTHITDDNNLHWVEGNEFPMYRDKEAWRTWSKKCSRQKWLSIKQPTNL